MAKVYDIFRKRDPYDTETLEEKESAYGKEIDSQFELVKETLKCFREDDPSYDPLSSVVLVPCDSRTSVTVMSLAFGDSKADLLEFLQMALSKVKALPDD